MHASPPDPSLVRQALAEPFSADYIQAKPGAVKGEKALAFFYVDARAVMDRLDDVFGVYGWQDHYEIALDKNIVLCRLSVWDGRQWVTKEDVGVHSPNFDSKANEDALDRAYKGTFSDALKRTAVKFGIARYLYDVPAMWFDFDSQYKRFKSPPKIPEKFLPGTKGPAQQSKVAADWIVGQLHEAKTAEDVDKVYKVVSERGAARVLLPGDSARADFAFAEAESRVKKPATP